MEIGIATMSSRGQIVLPKEVRKDVSNGEQFLIIREQDKWVMKKASAKDKTFREDLAFAQKTEDALVRMQKEDSLSFDSVDDFLQASQKW